MCAGGCLGIKNPNGILELCPTALNFLVRFRGMQMGDLRYRLCFRGIPAGSADSRNGSGAVGSAQTHTEHHGEPSSNPARTNTQRELRKHEQFKSQERNKPSNTDQDFRKKALGKVWFPTQRCLGVPILCFLSASFTDPWSESVDHCSSLVTHLFYRSGNENT